MRIQVLGSGCPTCEELYKRVGRAVGELGIHEVVEYITDVRKIVELGLMQSPVLVIDGVPVVVGAVPDVEKLKIIISRAGGK